MTSTAALAPPGVPPVSLGRVFTQQDALAAGHSRHLVQQLSRSGAWHRLAAGVHCRTPTWEAAGTDERTRLTAVAFSRRWNGAVVSHLSAAALWSLPLPLLPRVAAGAARQPEPRHATWLTAPPASGVSARRGAGLVIEVATLPRTRMTSAPPEIGVVAPTTSRARTVVDCLRHLPTPDAVAVADAAGASGVPREELLAVLAEQEHWPRAAAARAALGLVDPRRETWSESTSFVVLAGLGLPMPEPQVEVWTLEGRLIARVDGYWAQFGVVGEADGWAKYRQGDLSTAHGAERALREQKLREDALRAVGLEVARWDAWGVTAARGTRETEQRLRRAVERGDPSRVRAQLRSTAMPVGWRS